MIDVMGEQLAICRMTTSSSPLALMPSQVGCFFR